MFKKSIFKYFEENYQLEFFKFKFEIEYKVWIMNKIKVLVYYFNYLFWVFL